MSRSRLPAAGLAAAAIAACVALSDAAAAPAPATIGNPIVVTNGGATIGQMRFEVGYDDATATGIANASAIKLAVNRTYRIETCVWAKSPGQRPVSSCQSKTKKVDFIGSFSGVSAPSASLGVTRPAAGGGSATIAGIVVILEQHGSDFVNYASSWPYEGLPAAGVAVPAVGQDSGTVLPAQGTPLPGVRPGGIDSGAQDMICQGVEVPATTGSRGSTDALGSLAAPYEVQEPAGKVRGTMLLFHGGAWELHGPGTLADMHADADRWLARGWRTVNADHRPCGGSIDDAVAAFDRVSQTYGTKLPICAAGRSSGGHLALVIANVRPKLACVISEAGLSDLVTLPQAGSEANVFPIQLANVTVASFGADRQADLSPARHKVRARVLYGVGTDDPSVPWSQATTFAQSQKGMDPNAVVVTQHLAPGGTYWVHVPASDAAIATFDASEERLVKPLLTGGVSAPASISLGDLTSKGLPLRFACPAACKLAVRASEKGKALGSAGTRQSRFTDGVLTIRLGSRARKAVRRGSVKLSAELKTRGKTRRISVLVRVR